MNVLSEFCVKAKRFAMILRTRNNDAVKSKLILLLVLVLSVGWFGCNIARADMGMYESVEWMTEMADQIGVYQATNIYGPHSVTNGPGRVSCCSCTADFKLEKALRGNPPATYSRTRPVQKPEQLGFRAGGTYIFFLISEERFKKMRSNGPYPEDTFFTWGDYLWLNRPSGERNGVAIDHKGRVLTDRDEILKLVEASLTLPRAYEGIDRGAFFYRDVRALYPDCTNFNFRVITFPTAESYQSKESWVTGPIIDWTGLVIPQEPGETNSGSTNRLRGP